MLSARLATSVASRCYNARMASRGWVLQAPGGTHLPASVNMCAVVQLSSSPSRHCSTSCVMRSRLPWRARSTNVPLCTTTSLAYSGDSACKRLSHSISFAMLRPDQKIDKVLAPLSAVLGRGRVDTPSLLDDEGSSATPAPAAAAPPAMSSIFLSFPPVSSSRLLHCRCQAGARLLSSSRAAHRFASLPRRRRPPGRDDDERSICSTAFGLAVHDNGRRRSSATASQETQESRAAEKQRSRRRRSLSPSRSRHLRRSRSPRQHQASISAARAREEREGETEQG